MAEMQLVWRTAGAQPVDFAFTGGTLLEKPDFPLEAEPENPSRTLSLKQPVVQPDFSFLSDQAGGPQITLLNALDVLSGLGLAVVIPTKRRSTYTQAELRRFILEMDAFSKCSSATQRQRSRHLLRQ